MRVTNQMMTSTLLNSINKNLGFLERYNTQGSTGKKIQKPSDDPIIASRALKFRTILSETEQYFKNSEQADSWISITEAAVKNVNSITEKMKGLMQQGATDTLQANDRKKLLTEYNSLIEQLEQELNTSYMGRYVFSGYRTDKPVIIKNGTATNVLNPEIYGDATATPPITNINGQNIQIQIGAGVTSEINTLATNIYSQADYDAFHDLGAEENFIGSPAYEALTPEERINYDNDLRTRMSAMITTIEEYRSKVSVEHTNIGVRTKRVELVQTRLQDDKANYTKLMSDNEDADLGEVTMNFNTANAAYQASLKIGMSVNQITLADYLR